MSDDVHVRNEPKAENLQASICLPLCRQERTSPLRPPHCIVGAAASTAIRADLPTPSNEMHVTTSGGSMRSRLPFAGPLQTCHKGKKKKTGPFVVRRP